MTYRDQASDRATAVATNAPVWGFGLSSAISVLKRFWALMGGGPRSLAMYPEDAAAVLRYQARRERLFPPHPLEGEAGKANVCFLVRTFAGRREIFWVDTETREVSRLVFRAFYRGYPEHYDMDIKPEMAARAAGQY